jgi:hypothetical protein
VRPGFQVVNWKSRKRGSSFIMGEGGGAGKSGTRGSAGVSVVRRRFWGGG